MSTTHADTLKSRWYRQKYYFDEGFMKPAPEGGIESYNPFDFYKSQSRTSRVNDNLHHIFANLDLEDEKEITRFYSKFGPLGLFDRDVNLIQNYPEVSSQA